MAKQRAGELRQEYEDGARAAHYAAKRWTRSRRARRSSAKEAALVAELLDKAGPVDSLLDVPCGTGRFHAQLSAHGPLWSVDASLAMLAEHSAAAAAAAGDAQGAAGAAWPAAAASAHALPFADGAFELVFCSRLLHHFEHAEERRTVLTELARVSQRFVLASYFDAACFQAWRNKVRGRFRGRYPVARRVFEADAAAAGLRPIARRALLPGISEQVWVLLEREAGA